LKLLPGAPFPFKIFPGAPFSFKSLVSSEQRALDGKAEALTVPGAPFFKQIVSRSIRANSEHLLAKRKP
jgi:hypothetical protein